MMQDEVHHSLVRRRFAAYYDGLKACATGRPRCKRLQENIPSVRTRYFG